MSLIGRFATFPRWRLPTLNLRRSLCDTSATDYDNLDYNYPAEALVFGESGSLGAMFAINNDNSINLSKYESVQNPDAKEYYDILINGDMNQIQAISLSTYRFQSIIGDVFLHPTCFAVGSKAFFTNYHCVPSIITLKGIPNLFKAIGGATNIVSAFGDKHWWELEGSQPSTNLIVDIERIHFVDIDIPNIKSPDLFDPYSKERWNKTWGTDVVDIAMLKTQSTQVSPYVLPALSMMMKSLYIFVVAKFPEIFCRIFLT